MPSQNLRMFVIKTMRWFLSGNKMHGKAHISKYKGATVSLCGAAVYSGMQVKWAHLCKRCEDIATKEQKTHEPK